MKSPGIYSAVKAGDRLHLQKKKGVSSGCKRVYDKVHFCTFCKSRIVSNIARHLATVHVDESAVQEILLLPKQCQQRKLLLQRLVNDGNFKHNINAIQQGKGEPVVGRRSTISAKNVFLIMYPTNFTNGGSQKRMLGGMLKPV